MSPNGPATKRAAARRWAEAPTNLRIHVPGPVPQPWNTPAFALSAGRWDKFRPYDPERGCLVTNLSRLPADKLDFGTGPPRLSIPLTIEKNGVGILARKEDYLLRLAYWVAPVRGPCLDTI